MSPSSILITVIVCSTLLPLWIEGRPLETATSNDCSYIVRRWGVVCKNGKFAVNAGSLERQMKQMKLMLKAFQRRTKRNIAQMNTEEKDSRMVISSTTNHRKLSIKFQKLWLN
ncbi:uncharacterized protein [Clytia hemisphaerica]|uniref:Uncharacterized protein n=1 Tax=Clytia hemisphaerica TaxID=252671 RepID=A0A7M5WJR8_9CNID